MIIRAIQLKTVSLLYYYLIFTWYGFKQFIFQAIEYLTISSQELKNYIFTDNDWVIFEQTKNFLELFQETITIVSASTYPTLLITVSLYNILIDHLEDIKDRNNIDSNIQEVAKICREKILEYYNKTNKTYMLAVILDPRFKMQYYENNSWKDLIEEIKKE